MAEQQAPTQKPTAAPAPAAGPAVTEKKKAPAKRKAPAKKSKVVFARGKRKTAVARASARPGTGTIRINSNNISLIQPLEIREEMIDAMNVSSRARELAAKVDISVNVEGGGISAQAQAVRTAIAKCLVELDGSDVLKNELMNYDRSFLVEDPRRVEPKKFLGPKARARFQTSYR